MSEPMTAESARVLADIERQHAQFMPDLANHFTRVADALDRHADMLDRQTVDREAVRKVISEHRDAVDKCGVQQYEQTLGDAAKDRLVEKWDDVDDEVTDVIFALMPASVVARELEWVSEYTYIWQASQTKHTYTITEYAGMDNRFMLEGVAPLKVGFGTLETAKAAAQAHYNDAISKAVKPGPDVSGLVDALESARDTFLHYARLHKEKSSIEGDVKSQANQREADKITVALSTFKGGE
jgi:hypothetical protein